MSALVPRPHWDGNQLLVRHLAAVTGHTWGVTPLAALLRQTLARHGLPQRVAARTTAPPRSA